ncbi:MAG: hypothetical protein QOE89_3779 [Pseudonocardiales bacterium]|nr:hypothetical protein [Pseudonocardiales bacterium]
MTAGGSTRSRRGLLYLTAAALAVAWLLPGRPVPIYDGIGAPDEPYRYVSVPPGVQIRTRPPTLAKVTVPVERGVASVVELFTSEQGPQAEADITGPSLLTVPPASGSTPAPRSITVTLTPLAPDPADPQIDGNIYRLTWVAGSSTPTFHNNGADLFYLRATVGPPPRATFLYRPGPSEPWRAVATELAGADIYSALIQGAGDYALTRRPFPAAATGNANSGTSPWSLILVTILILAMVGAVLTIRLMRIRSAT